MHLNFRNSVTGAVIETLAIGPDGAAYSLAERPDDLLYVNSRDGSGKPVSPTDGVRYLRGLSEQYRSTYTWAELVED